MPSPWPPTTCSLSSGFVYLDPFPYKTGLAILLWLTSRLTVAQAGLELVDLLSAWISAVHHTTPIPGNSELCDNSYSSNIVSPALDSFHSTEARVTQASCSAECYGVVALQ